MKMMIRFIDSPKLCFAALIFLAVLSVMAPAQEAQPVTVLGLDYLIYPWERVEICARLVSGNPLRLMKGLKGIPLNFALGGKVLGSRETGEEGWACIKRLGPDKGESILQVSFHGNADYPSCEGSAGLFVRRKNAPVVVTGIDGVLVDTPGGAVYSPRDNLRWCYPKAASSLRRLVREKQQTIVYLTSRELRWAPQTRQWLKEQGFPSGPVFFWDPMKDPLCTLEYRKQKLSWLKSRWPNTRVGLVANREHAEVYEEAGLQPIVLKSGDAKEASWPAVPDWQALEKILFER